MKIATKLTIAVLFCLSGIHVVSANPIGDKVGVAALQKTSTTKQGGGVYEKSRSDAIKLEAKDKQETAGLTKRIYANGDKGFGVTSDVDPKDEGGALKLDKSDVKLINYDGSKIAVKAFYNKDAGDKKTIGGMDNKNLVALTQTDPSPSSLKFEAVKTTKDKAYEFKVGEPWMTNAFTKETGEKEKNAKPT